MRDAGVARTLVRGIVAGGLVGPLAATTLLYSIQGARWGWLISRRWPSRVLLDVPASVYYLGPLGAALGLFGAAAATLLATAGMSIGSRAAWLRAGFGVGAAFGVVGSFVSLHGMAWYFAGTNLDAALEYLAGVGAGALVGVLVAHVSWQDVRQATEASQGRAG